MLLIWGMSFILFESQFPHLSNGDCTPSLTVFLWGLDENAGMWSASRGLLVKVPCSPKAHKHRRYSTSVCANSIRAPTSKGIQAINLQCGMVKLLL